jgi:hypothetical protein
MSTGKAVFVRCSHGTMLGLVSPHNAALAGKRDFYLWINHYTPDYIAA